MEAREARLCRTPLPRGSGLSYFITTIAANTCRFPILTDHMYCEARLRIAMVVTPLEDLNLRLASQIDVTDIVIRRIGTKTISDI